MENDGGDQHGKKQYRRKTAKENWQFLSKQLFFQIKMRKIAEYFMRIPSLPEQVIEPTFVETNCPRLQRLLMSPINRRLYFYHIFYSAIVMLDCIYAILM